MKPSIKEDRKYIDQNKKDKKTSNDLQNTTQKTKDYAIRTHCWVLRESWHFWLVIIIFWKTTYANMIKLDRCYQQGRRFRQSEGTVDA